MDDLTSETANKRVYVALRLTKREVHHYPIRTSKEVFEGADVFRVLNAGPLQEAQKMRRARRATSFE